MSHPQNGILEVGPEVSGSDHLMNNSKENFDFSSLQLCSHLVFYKTSMSVMVRLVPVKMNAIPISERQMG